MHVGGIIGILRFGPFAGVIRHLGYPDYLMTILGVSYALAGLALLATGVPRLTNGLRRLGLQLHGRSRYTPGSAWEVPDFARRA